MFIRSKHLWLFWWRVFWFLSWSESSKKCSALTVNQTPILLNPLTRRPILAFGPTFHKLLQSGYIYHNGELYPIQPNRYAEPILCSDWKIIDSQPPAPPGLLFAEKSSGILSTPGITQPDSLITRIQDKYDKNAKLCHRLDRDTSGVLALATDAAVHRQVSQQFESRQTTKIYSALVVGHVVQDKGTIDLPIGKEKAQEGYNRWVVAGEKPRAALTEYLVEQRFTLKDEEKDFLYTRLRVQPHTGRGQQIRLHLAYLGHAILGDCLHAPPHIATATPRLCLHAASLSFTLDDVRYTASIPASF